MHCFEVEIYIAQLFLEIDPTGQETPPDSSYGNFGQFQADGDMPRLKEEKSQHVVIASMVRSSIWSELSGRAGIAHVQERFSFARRDIH